MNNKQPNLWALAIGIFLAVWAAGWLIVLLIRLGWI